jgi:MarR family transcriptional regulator, organic hydroperoxide resistance regulator
MTIRDERLLYLMSRAAHALKNHLKREFSAAGVRVSPAQMGILFLLLEQDRRPMGELGRLLDVDNSAITGLVDRMEKEGILRRIPGTADRRQNLITITPAGRKEAQKAARVSHDTNNAMKNGFTEQEMEVFARVLSGLSKKFSGGDS